MFHSVCVVCVLGVFFTCVHVVRCVCVCCVCRCLSVCCESFRCVFVCARLIAKSLLDIIVNINITRLFTCMHALEMEAFKCNRAHQKH